MIASTRLWAQEWEAKGFYIEVLTSDEVLACEPSLFPEIAGAVAIGDEAQVSPTLLTQAFARAARLLGAEIYEQTDVLSMHTAPSTDHSKRVTKS
jgi:glycine/D-amino acid oxidase-like deaminating enzyme